MKATIIIPSEEESRLLSLAEICEQADREAVKRCAEMLERRAESLVACKGAGAGARIKSMALRSAARWLRRSVRTSATTGRGRGTRA